MIPTKKHIIVKDRVEIYKDFALNLLYHINHYYLDYESLSQDKDIYNHFSFCFNKVCDEFLEEGLDFSMNEELKNYYYSYYYHQFYTVYDNENIPLEQYKTFWENIFEIDKQKNRNILNILIEIYIIHDNSINHEKNILEIV